MGIVTKTIGTSARDYSTIQAWEDALPANLVTDGNSQVGQLFNDSEFVNSTASTAICTISGETTDSTHTITLTTGAGQSFRDAAGVQSNALAYNQANGVGIKLTGHSSNGILVQANFVTISNLQISNSGTNYTDFLLRLFGSNGAAGNCVFQQKQNGYGLSPIVLGPTLSNPSNLLFNSVVICVGGGAGITIGNDGLMFVANCTIVKPSNDAGFGTGVALKTNIGGHYGGLNKSVNNAIFGFASFTDDVTNFGSSGNGCTDLASTTVPGSSNQVSKTYSSQFQNTTVASADFRAKPGADVLNNGATDTTDIPGATDIVGTSRPQGAAWDIGAWELVSGSALTISITQGSYTLTGKTQTLTSARSISSVQGSYALTGQAQTLNRGRPITAAQGAYTVTGKPQTLNRGITSSATQGSYTVTGQAQTLTVGLPATQGSYAVTGKPQSFAVALSSVEVKGNYAVTGFPQVLSYTQFGAVSSPLGGKFIADVGNMTARTY